MATLARILAHLDRSGTDYFASVDRVDVVRLLADAQDIAAVLADIEYE